MLKTPKLLQRNIKNIRNVTQNRNSGWNDVILEPVFKIAFFFLFFIQIGTFHTTKKKKVAIMVGYIGTGYYGLQMQSNPNFPTIEPLIIDAIYKSGGILKSNYEDSERLRKICNYDAKKTNDSILM